MYISQVTCQANVLLLCYWSAPPLLFQIMFISRNLVNIWCDSDCPLLALSELLRHCKKPSPDFFFDTDPTEKFEDFARNYQGGISLFQKNKIK